MMSLADFTQKCARHPWVLVAGWMEMLAVFCAFPVIVVADSWRGVLLEPDALMAQFAWWPWALMALVVTVVWFWICEDRELVAVIALLPRLVVLLALYFLFGMDKGQKAEGAGTCGAGTCGAGTSPARTTEEVCDE